MRRGSATASDLFSYTYKKSLDMIFSQYRETCEVLPKYSAIGGEDINYYVKKAISNILHENIDIHTRRLISELPVY